jgi:hypothetical protein
MYCVNDERIYLLGSKSSQVKKQDFSFINIFITMCDSDEMIL